MKLFFCLESSASGGRISKSRRPEARPFAGPHPTIAIEVASEKSVFLTFDLRDLKLVFLIFSSCSHGLLFLT